LESLGKTITGGHDHVPLCSEKKYTCVHNGGITKMTYQRQMKKRRVLLWFNENKSREVKLKFQIVLIIIFFIGLIERVH